jgi:hypothetical protein
LFLGLATRFMIESISIEIGWKKMQNDDKWCKIDKVQEWFFQHGVLRFTGSTQNSRAIDPVPKQGGPGHLTELLVVSHYRTHL